MRTVKGTVLIMLGIVAAIVLVGLGSCAEREACESEAKKLKRIPTHSNEWRDAQ